MTLLIALIALVGMGVVLFRYLRLKRELVNLKQEMKKYQLENGFDNALWVMFTERTRKMLK